MVTGSLTASDTLRNSMRRYLPVSALLLIMGLAFLAQAETGRRGLHLKLSGGVGSFAVGDFNTFFGDTIPYYESVLSPYGFTRQGEYQELRKAWNASGEIVVDLSRVFSAGLAVEYHQADNRSSFSWSHPEYNSLSVDITPSLNVVPIKLNAYATLPLTPALNSYVNGGLGIYTARATFDYLEDSRIPEDEGMFKSEIRANGTGFGIHGGLGLELKLSPGLALFTEGSYRYAKLGNLDGRMSVKADSPFTETVMGKIWYFEFFDDGSSRQLSGISFGEKPEEEGLAFLRELELDLSGFSLKIGFRVRFTVWE